MARKKQQEEHDNHERWMVSYADFITLLFAFFVVMYSISSVNEGKYKVLSDSLGSAFGTGVATPISQISAERQQAFPLRRQTVSERKQIEALRRERVAMSAISRQIAQSLAPLVKSGIVRVTQTSRGVKVEINASILFAPGDARLKTAESSDLLIAIAGIIKDDVHALQVEGHTDNLPISNSAFPSNWELSSARASTVVRLLADNGIARQRLSAVGYADNFPVGANSDTEGRVRNRRVEIMILAGLPEKATEVPLAPEGAE